MEKWEVNNGMTVGIETWASNGGHRMVGTEYWAPNTGHRNMASNNGIEQFEPMGARLDWKT